MCKTSMVDVNNHNFHKKRIIKFNFLVYSVLSYYFKCTNFQPLQQPLQKMLAQGNQQSILCITLLYL